MKNRLKLILVLILCLIMTVSMPLSSYAETVDANGSSSQGTTGKGASSYNIKNAPKSDKTGVLFYLVDKNGKIVSTAIDYHKGNIAGTNNDYTMKLRFGNAKRIDANNLTNWCNLPPFDAKASGNGRRMRDWLMMKTGEKYNVTLLVTELWGPKTAQEFIDEDHYLIIEPYMWCSLYKGSTYVADVCATTLGWAELQGKVGGNSYTSRYTIGNLPLSMYLDKDLPFMKKAPQVSTGKELDPNIIKTYGYGCIAVSAREAAGAPIEEEPKENGSYLDNEKIIVHTPVIAPVTIIDSEENKVYDDTAGTQLIHENLTSDREIKSKDGTTSDKKAAAELLLDETYTFKFDPALHREIQGYGWSGEPSKYDKYVYAKRVRFPFSVQVNGVFYEPVADENHKDTDVHGKEHYYTDWITLYDRDVDGEGNVDAKTIKKFYIPPYAEESTYWEIEYRVEAYNVYDSRGNEHEDETEGTANTELQPNTAGKNYVATYKVPVEVSGIVYDFQVLGAADYTYWYVEGKDKPEYLTNYKICSFTPKKMEKKQGYANRTGSSTVRYELDGLVTNKWTYKNTLPMAAGISPEDEVHGYLRRNEDIWFSVKTISNMAGEKDSVPVASRRTVPCEAAEIRGRCIMVS